VLLRPRSTALGAAAGVARSQQNRLAAAAPMRATSAARRYGGERVRSLNLAQVGTPRPTADVVGARVAGNHQVRLLQQAGKGIKGQSARPVHHRASCACALCVACLLHGLGEQRRKCCIDLVFKRSPRQMQIKRLQRPFTRQRSMPPATRAVGASPKRRPFRTRCSEPRSFGPGVGWGGRRARRGLLALAGKRCAGRPAPTPKRPRAPRSPGSVSVHVPAPARAGRGGGGSMVRPGRRKSAATGQNCAMPTERAPLRLAYPAGQARQS